MEQWTTPPKKEGSSSSSSSSSAFQPQEEREGAEYTLSDEEGGQLSYPGTDDEEYEGGEDSSDAFDEFEDASEDGLESEDVNELVDDAVSQLEENSNQQTDNASSGVKLPSFRDILLGRTAPGGTVKDKSAEREAEDEEGEDEWETDEEGENSPDFPKLGEKTPAKETNPPAQAKAAESSNTSAKSSGGPSLPKLPPRGGSKAKSNDQQQQQATAEPSAAKEKEKTTTSKPGLPARPALPTRNKAATQQQQQPVPPQQAAAAAAGNTNSTSAAESNANAASNASSASASGPVANLQPTRVAQAQAQQQQPTPPEVPELSEEKQRLVETVMEHRIKLIRIAKRLGVGADNHVIKQVIFRLDMTEQVKLYGRSSRTALKETFKEAEEKAAALESGGDDLDLECTVLVIGKTGVGKSTLVNNLLGLEDEEVPDERSTGIREVKGEVFGVKMHFIDVPGLQSSRSESKKNKKILNAAKRITKKRMPDIVLYCDRLDVPSYDFADIPLVRDISNTFGASIWWNALIVFTHGGSRAPEDSTGQIANFEYFQNHRGYIVQQMIRQAAGDARILNPVSVVECHHATKRNEDGEKLLPSGQAWRIYILLLCYASKVLHDANTALKLDNDLKDNKAAKNAQYAAFRRQQTPYPLFFNNLFQTRKPRRAQNLADEEDIAEMEATQEEKDYPLNPFKQPLDQGDSRIDIPAPDPALAPTFDCDPSTNAHRYRYLENSNGWICRAIVEPDGLEHDDGINGFTAENYYGSVADPMSKDPRKKNPIPTYLMSQISMPEKDKLNLVAEIESSVQHKGRANKTANSDGTSDSGSTKKKSGATGGAKGDGGKKPIVTTGGIDVQTLGRDIMYVARTETRIKQTENMKMCAGVSGFRSSLKLPTNGPMAFGAKVEERVKLNRRLRLNMTAGAIGGKAVDGKTNQYLKGANVQFMVKGNKKKGEPTKFQVIGTAMHWKKDIALGGDVQCIQMVGPDSALTARANLNSRGSGSVQLRLTSTDTIKYALVGVIPTVSALFSFFTGGMD
jgi:energy-coupling factor transporter ATP-binding protein EcfA2